MRPSSICWGVGGADCAVAIAGNAMQNPTADIIRRHQFVLQSKLPGLDARCCGWLGGLPLPTEVGLARLRSFHSLAEVGYIRLLLGEAWGEGLLSPCEFRPPPPHPPPPAGGGPPWHRPSH